VFEGSRDVTLQRTAIVASSDFFAGEWTFTLGAGPLLEGELAPSAGPAFDLGPGWIASASAAYNVLDGTGSAPFVIFGVSFGASSSRSRPRSPLPGEAGGSGRLVATDARIGVTVGKTFWSTLSPYASIRAFGGPVFWDNGAEDLGGSDKHHYQPALGVAVTLPAGFDLFGEGAPVGERAVHAGLGFSY
jgi:hypothetical protein